MSIRILTGDCLDRLKDLDDESVQCCVTSPPYMGLRAYLDDENPDKPKEIGLESLHDCLGWATGTACGACYVCKLVAVFRDVRRVLRDDGTLWLNLGDSYSTHSAGKCENPFATSGLAGIATAKVARKTKENRPYRNAIIPEKNLLMIPARVALALQADGWYVRSHIVWSKKSPMPESVKDRPTSAWESIFLLTKSPRYFYDADAVKEPSVAGHGSGNSQGRNLRNVWHLGPEPFPEEHFATFPSTVPKLAILAGTPEAGVCRTCRTPYVRAVEKTDIIDNRARGSAFDKGKTGVNGRGRVQPGERYVKRVGDWQPGCQCQDNAPVPAMVLDPFAGAGTTLLIADRLGRGGIGIELNPVYAEMARRRIENESPLFAEIAAT